MKKETVPDPYKKKKIDFRNLSKKQQFESDVSDNETLLS